MLKKTNKKLIYKRKGKVKCRNKRTLNNRLYMNKKYRGGSGSESDRNENGNEYFSADSENENEQQTVRVPPENDQQQVQEQPGNDQQTVREQPQTVWEAPSNPQHSILESHVSKLAQSVGVKQGPKKIVSGLKSKPTLRKPTLRKSSQLSKVRSAHNLTIINEECGELSSANKRLQFEKNELTQYIEKCTNEISRLNDVMISEKKLIKTYYKEIRRLDKSNRECETLYLVEKKKLEEKKTKLKEKTKIYKDNLEKMKETYENKIFHLKREFDKLQNPNPNPKLSRPRPMTPRGMTPHNIRASRR